MKKLLISILAISFSLLFLACNSLMSKLISGVKADAEKIVSAGKYKVLETTTSKRVQNTGQPITQRGGCTCKDVLWLDVKPINSASDDSEILCLSKDHEQLVDYAALRQGDVVSFELDENILDMECSGSPSTFLRVKK